MRALCPPSSVLRLLSSVLSLLAWAGCATPLRPSGGPEDRTPPQLVASVPAEGATRVTDRRLALTFSERVDEAALRRALVVAPAPATPPAVRVRGREVEVAFDSLRADVTYVVTLGTELRDLHGVALPAPITLAFATGERIDRGRIAGVVRDPATGRAAPGLSVLAYGLGADTTRRPDPRTAPADYRTQTGADGAFTLDYLRPDPYYVVALDDRNRNGRADAAEAFAAPPAPVLHAAEPLEATDDEPQTDGAPPPQDSTGAPAPVPSAPSSSPTPAFFLTRADTTAPTVRQVRARSPRLVAARFDEPVRLDSAGAGAWAVEDSASGRAEVVAAAWMRPDDAREVLVATAEALPATPHRLRLVREGAVRDSAGTAAAPFAVGVPPSAVADTARARFAGFLPDVPTARDSALVLRPGERPGVRFTLPLDTAGVRARLTVRDAAGRPLPYRLVADDAVSVRIVTGARDVRVQVGDTLRTRRFTAPAPDALGGVIGRVGGIEGPVIVEALPEGPAARGRPPFLARTGADGGFAFPALPPGAYRLRFFADRDGDGAWDGGTLAPYAPPEPLAWLRGAVRVRARWETDLGTVRFQSGEATADGLEDAGTQGR